MTPLAIFAVWLVVGFVVAVVVGRRLRAARRANGWLEPWEYDVPIPAGHDPLDVPLPAAKCAHCSCVDQGESCCDCGE